FHSRDLVGAGRSALPKYSRMTGTLFFRKSLSRGNSNAVRLRQMWFKYMKTAVRTDNQARRSLS
ncbi:hypothetical protein, partial [Nostoc sp.]|uniref:hypothetical protein n=1 Tax=Nostoc sp. TaxID=1180 RepID=UPI002FFA93F8